MGKQKSKQQNQKATSAQHPPAKSGRGRGRPNAAKLTAKSHLMHPFIYARKFSQLMKGKSRNTAVAVKGS